MQLTINPVQNSRPIIYVIMYVPNNFMYKYLLQPVDTDNSKLSISNVHENTPDVSLDLAPMSVSSYWQPGVTCTVFLFHAPVWGTSNNSVKIKQISENEKKWDDIMYCFNLHINSQKFPIFMILT